MDSLEQIAKEIRNCASCPLRANATAPVPGFGPTGCKYMLIGEAPGRHEDEAGIPFVGAAGQKLNKLVKLANIDLNECYLTNVCRCRPTGNRTPKKKEVKACSPFLWREIKVVRPETIITLGSLPLSLFSTNGVRQMHGTSFEFDVPE